MSAPPPPPPPPKKRYAPPRVTRLGSVAALSGAGGASRQFDSVHVPSKQAGS